MKQSLAQQMRFAHREEEVKDIFQNYFNLGNVGLGAIDLSLPHIYFEAKHENTDIERMLAQLVLTIHRDSKKIDLPEYIGGFDNTKCGFVEFDDLYQSLETSSDMNWNQTPSAVDNKTIALVRNFIADKLVIYKYDTDEKELYVALHKIISGRGLRGQILRKKINTNNFVSVFMKWQKELSENIQDISCDYNKHTGITPGDFYLADLLSCENQSIPELDRLKILRDSKEYKSNVKIHGELFNKTYTIINPDKHNLFWNKYQRPPKREYWRIIQERRDLLVPQKIREITGAFFTPQIWVEKSQEYMAAAFGEDFANMYIWDCAAGTGNLLVGLPQQRHNIFASTLMEPDVEIMRQTSNLFDNHIFQFDFLNDDFIPVRDGGKMPDRLYDIIQNPDEQKKLIIYINPPYSETHNRKSDRSGVAKNNRIYEQYAQNIGKASNELFAQFITRIYLQIPHSVLTLFSTLKIVSAPNFTVFRNFFRAKYIGGFVVRANTFDNVGGQFPIAFTMWNLADKQPITNISCNILENDGEMNGRKRFFAYNNGTKFINDWIRTFRINTAPIGIINFTSNDMQQQNYVVVLPNGKPMGHNSKIDVSTKNLIESCIYVAVRHSITPTWLNDRDQFLFPTMHDVSGADNLLESRQEFLYESDDDFKNNCLIYTLFHTQNRISSNDSINHWIPFTEDMVGCRSAFSSSFMSQFLSDRQIPTNLSPAAMSVYNAGLNIWRYYHAHGANQNASLYDIKEFFKGRNNTGKMNNKSTDSEFNRLESELSVALHALADEIEPKIYEYGFLKK